MQDISCEDGEEADDKDGVSDCAGDVGGGHEEGSEEKEDDTDIFY